MTARYSISYRSLVRPESKEGENDGLIGTVYVTDVPASNFDDAKTIADELAGETGEVYRIAELEENGAEVA